MKEIDITVETRVEELVQTAPTVISVFQKHGLRCMTCHGIAQDTLGHVIVNNGLSEHEFLQELRESLSN